MFSWFSILEAKYDKLAYDFSFSGVDGKEILLSNYKEKIIIVVNVASRCGFTYQYEDLQNLYSKYKSQNVVVSVFALVLRLSIEGVFWLVRVEQHVHVPPYFLGCRHWIWILFLWDRAKHLQFLFQLIIRLFRLLLLFLLFLNFGRLI